MTPKEEKEDLAAPVSENQTRSCPRCQALVPADASTCPSCGAPILGLHVADDEPTLQRDLANANLHRMRQQFSEAESLCLQILERSPHNVEAHTLLGDIFADQAQWESAAQWYELALDIDPESFNNKQKLQLARDRLWSAEHQSTVEQLGLPQNTGYKAALVAVVSLAVILACGMIAYALGQRNARSEVTQDVIRDSVVATTPAEVPKQEEPAPETQPPPRQPAVNDSTPQEDQSLLAMLSAGTYGKRIISVWEDPRTHHVNLTFRLEHEDAERKIAAQLGRDALSALGDSPAVTVRGVRSGRVAYLADITRERLNETGTPEWMAENSDPDAWIAYVPQNEWFATQAAQPSDQRP